MKALFCLLCLYLAGCSTFFPESPYTGARKETVMVQTPSGHGTGVVINDKCILTAGHVSNDGTEYVIVNDAGDAVPASLVVADNQLDVAIACSKTSLHARIVKLARAMPEQYEPVFTIGFPLNFSKVLTKGVYEQDGLATCSSAPGNSGGGVFNARGEYIGLVDAISIYGGSPVGAYIFSHLVSFVEVTDIRKFLDDNHITYTLS